MGLINKIRERSGLAVGLVAVGLGLFIVGSDIFGPNSSIMGQNKQDVGEISGQLISLERFQTEIDQLKYNYSMSSGRTPTENEMTTIRQQAWEYLIVKIAFQEEYDKLGIRVTDDEQWDMVQGRNVNWEIRQAFSNPATGEFQREQLLAYLKNIRQMPPQQQTSWMLFEQNLSPSRLRFKYDNLLTKSTYVTEAEARMQYDAENSVAEIRYLYVPYYSVNDSLVSVTDNELREYLKAHSAEYQVEESRDISYVSIPVVPSARDTAFFQEELNRIAIDFRESQNDSLFARASSDGLSYFNRYTIDQLPASLQANLSNLSAGDVRGPYFENDRYVLYKISGMGQDTAFTARASHILIKWTDESAAAKAEARAKAQDLLNQLNRGASFADLAREHSEDGSAQQGGDLGWFGKGRMVPPFEEAVFGATRPGLINRIVETQFGYHLIDVTQAKSNEFVDVATIERDLLASDETRNSAFRKADYFASTCSNAEEFRANALRDSLQVNTAASLGMNDRRLNNIANARSVIQWAYDDETSIGDVSPVRELDNQYIVATLNKMTRKGTALLEDVREQITLKVKNQKKSAIIAQKLGTLSGTLDEMAEKYGPDARVYTYSDLKLSGTSLPTAGFVPEAIGAIFAMEEGKRSNPLTLENGVLVAELITRTKAPEIADYASYRLQLENNRSQDITFRAADVIRTAADIQDKRYRFF
jgi:peptidyl-prolyl cis-trans isomerase D